MKKLVFYSALAIAMLFTACKQDEPNAPADDSNAPDANGYAYVDLGLPSGTLWATKNIGATSVQDYGCYVAWGETQAKPTYGWDTYQFMTEGMATWSGISKYTFADGATSAVWYSISGDFIGDNKTVLELADDVAHVTWGGNWRLPTIEQIDELKNTDNCTWKWTAQKKVNGYLITSKLNGNSIFLPAAGCIKKTDITDDGYAAYYWSNALYQEGSHDANCLHATADQVKWYGNGRYTGLPVRAVLTN